MVLDNSTSTSPKNQSRKNSEPDGKLNQQSEQLFFNVKDFIKDLIQTLNSAQKSIDMEMFIFEKDEMSSPIIECLKQAAARNVKVRILVDGVGSLKWITGDIDSLEQHNIQVRVFNPIKLKFFNSKINKRNHRKTIIIDESVVYVGSFNLSESYYLWRETILKMNNDLTPLLTELYSYTWTNAKTILGDRLGFKNIESKLLKSNQIFTTQSRALRLKYKDDFLKKIDEAKKRIWFTSPYFNPPRYVIKALIRAEERGVEVKLLLPQESDLPFLTWMTQLHYPSLIKQGVEIYEYTPQILHAKTYLIDDYVLLGTGNLNYRSFIRDIELNIALTDAHVIREIESQFKKDMESSVKMKSTMHMEWYKKIIGKSLYSFKTSF